MAQNKKVKHRVKLTEDEHSELSAMKRKGNLTGWKMLRIQALLLCDESEQGKALKDEAIAEVLDVSVRTLQSWRKQAVEQGPMSLLERKPVDRSYLSRLDGEGEAKLLQLACSPPPKGHARWSLNLLADKLVELKVVESISYESVRRTLKKTRSSPGG